MSLGAVFILVAVGLIAWQIWTGSAWIVGPHTRGRGLNDAYSEHFVHRAEFPRLFWLSIGIQAAVVSFVLLRAWWRV